MTNPAPTPPPPSETPMTDRRICPTCCHFRDADVPCSDAFHIAPPSETKLSEAIDELIRLTRNQMYVDKDYGRTPDGQETQAQILRSVARSSLESLYREQALENERLKENLEQSIKNNGYLLGRYAKSYLLTPEEAQMILDSQPMITSATREKLQRISSKATSEEL